MHYTASAVRYPLYDIQCTVSTIRYLMYSIRNKTFPVRHSVCNMQCEVTPLFRVGSLCVFTSWFCRFCWNVILQHLYVLVFFVSVETSYCNIFTSWFCRFCWNVILQHLHVLVLSFLLKRHIAHLYVLVLSSVFLPESSVCFLEIFTWEVFCEVLLWWWSSRMFFRIQGFCQSVCFFKKIFL